MSFLKVSPSISSSGEKRRSFFINEALSKPENVSKLFPSGSSVQTEIEKDLQNRIRIQRSNDRGGWLVVGEGGYGTAFKATLLINGDKEMPCVVKIPSFLISKGYIRISEEGLLIKHGDREIPKDRNLLLFNQEIKTLAKLRKGDAYVKAGITDPGISIRNTTFVAALKEARNLPLTHKGHEFIHRLLEYNTGSIPCLVSEFCHGNLLELNCFLADRGILKKGNFFVQNITHWMQTAVYEIYQGISYMHNMQISHNDIKPDNIFFLFQERGRITYRISDFGLCSGPQPSSDQRGTKLYESPELIRIKENPNAKYVSLPFGNDAYAFGLTCLELLFMTTETNDPSETTDKVVEYVSQVRNISGIPQIFLENMDGATRADFIRLHNILFSLCVSREKERIRTFDTDLRNFWDFPGERPTSTPIVYEEPGLQRSMTRSPPPTFMPYYSHWQWNGRITY